MARPHPALPPTHNREPKGFLASENQLQPRKAIAPVSQGDRRQPKLAASNLVHVVLGKDTRCRVPWAPPPSFQEHSKAGSIWHDLSLYEEVMEDHYMKLRRWSLGCGTDPKILTKPEPFKGELHTASGTRPRDVHIAGILEGWSHLSPLILKPPHTGHGIVELNVCPTAFWSCLDPVFPQHVLIPSA